MSSSGAQLEGMVTRDDNPVVGARVRIAADAETPYNRMRRDSTTTDQKGHFLFTGMAPGKYRVTAKSAEDSATELAEAEPQSVTVAESDHKTIEMKLIPPKSQ